MLVHSQNKRRSSKQCFLHSAVQYGQQTAVARVHNYFKIELLKKQKTKTKNDFTNER